jgi:hypothetical protein
MPTDTAVLAKLIKNMKNAEHDPLRPLIDAYHLEKRRSVERLREYHIDMVERPRPGGRFSPSSIAGCERKSFFSFVGMPGRSRVDPDLEGIFDDGNWRHHRWQATFHDMEHVLGPDVFKVISIEEYVRIPRLYIAGSLDALVKMEGKKWVIDFKGINDYGFKYVKQQGAPKIEHVHQLLTYMRARRVRRGILLYENKNNNTTLSFPIEFDPDKWAYIERWVGRVVKQMEREELPEKHVECVRGNFIFEQCAFADHCYGKRSSEKVRRAAYKRYKGVDEMWEHGEAIMSEHLEVAP